MMKHNRIALITTWILAFLPLLLIAAVYQKLPAQVPMQWGFNGTVRYDDKASIWMAACLGPFLGVLFLLLPKIDPRRRNYEKFMGIYDGFMVVMMLFLLAIHLVVISESFYPGRINVSTVVIVCVGLLFVFLGNILPKVKSNFFFGARTPWTLSDPEVWNKTNRLTGYLFFFGGIIIALMPLFLGEMMMFIAMMVLVAAMSIIPLVMSYVWYRQRKQDD